MEYFASVVWLENGNHYKREFWINQGCFVGKGHHFTWNGAPTYLVTEIYRALWILVQSDDYRIYEYTRDGEKRYEELRYHDHGQLKSMIARRAEIGV